ncbi:MAG: hypothetical protein HY897_25185 [Deltaproteobacteria bacterium]|nr:hypothetical protein [Deltaproteobacteria bacterium]
MDTRTYDRVKGLYLSLGDWSRNRAFFDFADPRSHRALKLARHLAAVRRALNACDQGAGTYTVERLRGGGVALHFRYDSIAARWTVYLGEREYDLITTEELCECEPPRAFFLRPRPS